MPTAGIWLFQRRHLHVDEKLPEVAWRHHDGGVQLSNVAFVQSDVMVGGQPLKTKSVINVKVFSEVQLLPVRLLTLWKS